jgi:hypothetical protein
MLLVVDNGNGLHFGHHCPRRASPISKKQYGRYELINFYFNLLNLLSCFDSGIGTNMRKAAHPQVASIHQNHAARGLGSSTTMVMVFVR